MLLGKLLLRQPTLLELLGDANPLRLVDWLGHASRGDPIPLSSTRSRSTSFTGRVQADGGFGNDCSTPLAYSVFFGKPGGPNAGTQIILKEDQYPGRWAIVPIIQDGSHSLFVPNTFATADLSGWAVGSGAYDLFVADVNADAKIDLIAKEKNSGAWAVALGTGSTFIPEPSLWLPDWANPSSNYDLFVADVNNDQRADLIRKEKTSPVWHVALSTGTAFDPQSSPWLSTLAGNSSDYDLFMADVDADGDSDIIAKEKLSPGYWRVALSNGMNGFSTPTVWLPGGWAEVSSAYNLFVADVDGINGADLIAKEKNSPGQWYVALSNGINAFVPAPNEWRSGWAVQSSEYALYVADVNNDGRADLIAKDALGKWYAAHSIDGGFQPQSVLALDPPTEGGF